MAVIYRCPADRGHVRATPTCGVHHRRAEAICDACGRMLDGRRHSCGSDRG